MSANFERVIGRLGDRVVRRHGTDAWARSPTREEKEASLHVWLAEDGWVAFKDFGGATREDILAALGLTLRDIGPTTEAGRPAKVPGPPSRTASPTEAWQMACRVARAQLATGKGCALAYAGERLGSEATLRLLEAGILALSGQSVHELAGISRSWSGEEAVALPTFDIEGNIADVQFRLARESKDKNLRFRRVAGAAHGKLVLFGGPEMLYEAVGSNLVVVAGFFDYLCGRTAGLATIGLVGEGTAGNVGRAVGDWYRKLSADGGGTPKRIIVATDLTLAEDPRLGEGHNAHVDFARGLGSLPSEVCRFRVPQPPDATKRSDLNDLYSVDPAALARSITEGAEPLLHAGELSEDEARGTRPTEAGSIPRAAAMLDLEPILQEAGILDLGPDPSAQALDVALRALASSARQLDPLRQQILRREVVSCLKTAKVSSAAAMVDAALSKATNKSKDIGSGQPLDLIDPTPWPEPVDGSSLLDRIRDTFSAYLVLPAGGAVALALWTALTHLLSAVEINPRLAVQSPTKRCGKTNLFTVLVALVRRPLPTSNVSSAAVYRVIEDSQPTLLIDEADRFLGLREDLIGILNSGHSRAMARVTRCVGDDQIVHQFSTWAPMAIAGIGRLPGTLQDRSIVVQMRRKAAHERVQQLRLDRLHSNLEHLRQQLFRWATDVEEQVREADPEVPLGLDDRAADNWRPLLAIAEAAGGDWPAEARRAIRSLARDRDEDETFGVQLLADIRETLANQEDIASEELVAALLSLKDRPWGECNNGKPLTENKLARLLSPFEIIPKKMRLTDITSRRGYRRTAFEDAWARYLPPPATSEEEGM